MVTELWKPATTLLRKSSAGPRYSSYVAMFWFWHLSVLKLYIMFHFSDFCFQQQKHVRQRRGQFLQLCRHADGLVKPVPENKQLSRGKTRHFRIQHSAVWCWLVARLVIKHSLRKKTVEILRLINPGPGQLTTVAVSREHPPERSVNIYISMNVTCYVAVVDCECNRFAVNVIHS